MGWLSAPFRRTPHPTSSCERQKALTPLVAAVFVCVSGSGSANRAQVVQLCTGIASKRLTKDPRLPLEPNGDFWMIVFSLLNYG